MHAPVTRPQLLRVIIGAIFVFFAWVVFMFPPSGETATETPGGYFSGSRGTTGPVRLLLSLDGSSVTGYCSTDSNGVAGMLTGAVDTFGRISASVSSGGRGEEGTNGFLTGRIEGSPVYFRGYWQGFTQTNAVPVEFQRVALGKTLRSQSGYRVGRFGGTKQFSAAFPEFVSRDGFHQDINRTLQEDSFRAAESFISGSVSHTLAGLRSPSAGAWHWEGNQTFEIVHDSLHLVSMRQSTYEYSGGAHGMSADRGRNFVIADGHAREFNLPDLFAAGTDWQPRLAQYCLEDLRRQTASSVIDGSVTNFSDEELSAFTVSPSGIQIHFAPYAVGCYAEGAFVVHAPWHLLRSCLKKPGPGVYLDATP